MLATNAAFATLQMLRKQSKPVPVPGPTKRPPGGRPNPCALHRISSTATYPTVTRKQRENIAGLSPDDFANRFIAAVMSGEIPAGQSLDGTALRRAMKGQKPQGSWENLSATLAARNAPIRLRSENVQRGRGTYRVEIL
jgi:hypothetical protein